MNTITDEQYNRVIEDLRDHETWQIRTEERLRSLAPQDWVHKVVEPIKESVVEIKHAMNSMKTSLEVMSNTQNEILREKAVRDREESQQRQRQQEEKHVAEMKALMEKVEAEKLAAKEKSEADLDAARSKSVHSFMEGSGKVIAWVSGAITLFMTLLGGLLWFILHSK